MLRSVDPPQQKKNTEAFFDMLMSVDTAQQTRFSASQPFNDMLNSSVTLLFLNNNKKFTQVTKKLLTN